MGKRKAPSENSTQSVKSATKQPVKPPTKQSSDSSDDEFTKPKFSSGKSSSQSTNQSSQSNESLEEADDLAVHIVERPESINQHRSTSSSLLPESSSESDSDSDDESAPSIKINQSFADKYEAEKRKAELSKKAQRGKKTSQLLDIMQNMKSTDSINQSIDSSDNDSSDDEDEDDDGELLTKDIDQTIQHTLNLIKAKDPRLYDSSVKFFDEDSIKQASSQSTNQPKSKKAMSVKEAVLAGMDEESDDEDDDDETTQSTKLTFVQEQQKLKRDFLANAAEIDEDDELFSKKPADSMDETADGDDDMDLFAVKIKSGEAIQPDEFLSAYLKHEWWKVKNPAKLPSYESITGEAPPSVMDEDQEAVDFDTQEQFEQAYNFRFEEAGGGKIVTHPRQIVDSLRKVDSRRKDERERKKEKKMMEKMRVDEEIKKIKNQRLAELKAQAQKIAAVAGKGDASLGESINLAELEGDWDESAHEKLMSRLFDSEYYEGDADSDELIEQIRREEREDELKYGAMDASMKKQSSDSSSNQSIDKKLDQLYEMDYEDIIAGGLKTRFKYRQVQANDYGIPINQLLDAEDKVLNQKVSLKKLASYADEYDANDRDHSNNYSRHSNSKFDHDQSKRFTQSQNRTNYQSNSQKPAKSNRHVIAEDDKPINQSTSQSQKPSKPSKLSKPASQKPVPVKDQTTKPESTAAIKSSVKEDQSIDTSESGSLTAAQKRRLREKKRKTFNQPIENAAEQEAEHTDEPRAKRVKLEA